MLRCKTERDYHISMQNMLRAERHYHISKQNILRTESILRTGKRLPHKPAKHV